MRHAATGLRPGAILASCLLALLGACAAPSRPAASAGATTAGGEDAAESRHASTSAPAVAPLVVASDLDNMPFAGVDENGTPIGRDVEMMEAIGEALGRPIRWHRADFETLLPSAQGGWPDVVCATIGVTEERARKVIFSRPYFETVITVVVRSGEGEPRGWDDLNGRLVAAGTGTTSELAVRRKLPRAVLAPASKQNLTSAERLLLGEVDGIAMDGPNAEALVADSGGALTTLHTALTAERYALALPRDRMDLLAAIDEALLELETSGQMKRWNGKWGLRPMTGSPDR